MTQEIGCRYCRDAEARVDRVYEIVRDLRAERIHRAAAALYASDSYEEADYAAEDAIRIVDAVDEMLRREANGDRK